LALPASLRLSEFDELIDGFVALARAEGAPLVGGNLSSSPGPMVLDVTAVGAAGRRRLLRRGTANRGDELYVTGSIGAAAAGLAMLQAGEPREGMTPSALACVARYEKPEPRTRCGRAVGRSRAAAAAIDLSDGLADGARRLARDSGLGIVLDAAALPIHDGARDWAARSGVDPIGFVLSCGEDYELAFAVRPKFRRRFLAAIRRSGSLAATKVGVFTKEPEMCVERDGLRVPLGEGFAHFSPAS
jgi:thiamine-monophosphate kinase